MSHRPFYITTTLPYINADPHIGFAMELIRADIIARSKKLSGHEVFFNTGTDEHGQKIFQSAKARGLEPQAYADEYSARFKSLLPALGIMPEANFIRTTDPHHIAAAQEFWKLVYKNGFIYKKNYAIKYCVGCELEKTESELVNGHCPLHPLMEIEVIQEENYFFKFSVFQKQLQEFYVGHEDFVVPDFRYNEIKSFVAHGLEDFSISRLTSKMSWGVPVPNDADHTMYVWFDALVDYVSAIGWPDKSDQFKKWWIESGGVIQYCGKDNLRQQSAMWQAMLMAAGLPNSQKIVINGFITGDGGIKMSKSLGNTVDPFEIVKEYGTDALRYYVARELHPFEDSPFSAEKFKYAYNAHLANGLGNLVSRVMKMAQENLDTPIKHEPTLPKWYEHSLNSFNLKELCDHIWKEIQEADALIQKEQPFKLVKSDPKKGKELITDLVKKVAAITLALQPIFPSTAGLIRDCIDNNKMPAAPLFVRK